MSTRQEFTVNSSVQKAIFEKAADLSWSAINEIEVTQWCYDPLPGNAIKTTKPNPNMDQYWIIPIDMSDVAKWDRITETERYYRITTTGYIVVREFWKDGFSPIHNRLLTYEQAHHVATGQQFYITTSSRYGSKNIIFTVEDFQQCIKNIGSKAETWEQELEYALTDGDIEPL